ncbi:efflux transporter outer membrane subunit [Xanthomarina sp. F2636L]|uniref:efflux transporter outer membrane subunit n=1 Tax=Xanthomarina sp. F2636L TaxID=2996018 RepID=UPI00225E02D5|nr:efflux transporter outer membrane subunit [Xanthomarina sp. F2636L]MCX7550373.1 efflux transporter outer membrane subunit [Xanthomarina sp. F2636L]
MNWYRLFYLSVVLFSMFFYGCKVQKDYIAPETENPTSFSTQTTDSLSLADTEWWEFFNDPVLTELISEGLNSNLPLQNIIIGIKQSQLQLDIAKAQLYPEVNYGLSAETSKTSLLPSFRNSITAVGQVSYTLDVWGRIANQNEAALQAYLATEMAVFEVKATMVSQIAELYFTLRDIDNKIYVSEQMEASMEKYKAIIDARYDGGFISKVDVNQISISLKDVQVTMQTLYRSRKQVENAISTVLGSLPKDIPRGKKLEDQVFSSELPVGVPAGLLRRRPSILKSELQLKAQLAQLGATETFKYPNFQIDFNLGAQLLDPSAVFGNLVGSMFGPVFNGNKINNTIAIEEEQYHRMVLDYKQAYLIAFQEVEDALIAIETYKEEVVIRSHQLELAEEAYNLAWVRYNEGATSFLEFLNVQTTFFTVQLTASESYKSQLQSVVKLYLALGGGWNQTN